MSKKKYIIFGLILIFIGLGFFLFNKKANAPVASEIKSYEDCINFYPKITGARNQCKTPDGRTFAEETVPSITYVSSSKDLIVVDMPTPGAVTGKEFVVSGKARGTWYFEASFPVEVLDKDGKQLWIGPAQAQSEWMTENFVPFKVTVKVPQSYIGEATLVLHKDNASGLPEHDASISFPFTIEYTKI